MFEQALADPSLDAAQMRSLEAGLVVVGLFEPQLVPLTRQRLGRFDPEAPLTDFDSRIVLGVRRLRPGPDRNPQGHRGRVGAAPARRRSHLLRTARPRLLWWPRCCGPQTVSTTHSASPKGLTRAGEDRGRSCWPAAPHGCGPTSCTGAVRSPTPKPGSTSAVDTAVAHGFTTVTNWAGSEYAIMLADRGDGPAALQVLHRLGLDGPLPDTVHLYSAQLAAWVVRVACGQTREGIDQIRAVGRQWEAIGVRNPDLAPWRPHLAQALLLAGEREKRACSPTSALPWPAAWGAHRPLARALRVQGLATGGEDGTALLHESVALARDSPGQLELASSLVEVGAAERRANHRAAAREPLEEGLALAHHCGARSLQERALAELLAAGARPRRPRPAAVTPSPPASCASPAWPAMGKPTGRSPSACSSPKRRSRPTCPTPSANCTSTHAPKSPQHSPANKPQQRSAGPGPASPPAP